LHFKILQLTVWRLYARPAGPLTKSMWVSAVLKHIAERKKNLRSSG
jgi:hypothetical protein